MPTIGVLTLEIHIEESHSLKEKRHVVKGLKDRLRSRFNVSVAEIDYQDFWQRAVVAAVTISGDHVHADECPPDQWSVKQRIFSAGCWFLQPWNG